MFKINITMHQPEKWLAQTAGKGACLILLVVHAWLHSASVLDKNSKLTVTVAKQATIVDICRCNDDAAVIHNQQLTVNIDQLRPLT